MSFTPSDLPDLRDRVAVVTGANSGLGLETARLLAGAGAHVVMTARSEAKYAAARDELLATNRRAQLSYVELDLADLGSVRRAAEQITAVNQRIDILVNNAGIMLTPKATTADGLELQLGTNHYGHFALTGLLMRPLLAADAARVTTVSSGAHHLGDLTGDDWHQRQTDGYDSAAAYSRSKLANLVFALELQRRFEAAGVVARSTSAHPGYTATNLQTSGVQMDGGGLFLKVLDLGMRVANPLVAMKVQDGALPQVHAAVSDVPGGTYWGPQGIKEMRGPVGPAKVNPKARDLVTAERLWADSVVTTGVTYDELAPATAR